MIRCTSFEITRPLVRIRPGERYKSGPCTARPARPFLLPDPRCTQRGRVPIPIAPDRRQTVAKPNGNRDMEELQQLLKAATRADHGGQVLIHASGLVSCITAPSRRSAGRGLNPHRRISPRAGSAALRRHRSFPPADRARQCLSRFPLSSLAACART